MSSDPKPVVIYCIFHYFPKKWVWLHFLCAVQIWGDLPCTVQVSSDLIVVTGGEYTYDYVTEYQLIGDVVDQREIWSRVCCLRGGRRSTGEHHLMILILKKLLKKKFILIRRNYRGLQFKCSTAIANPIWIKKACSKIHQTTKSFSAGPCHLRK